MPSYKHPLWIGEAIESVLSQTFSDLELVIVDDGSNDDSAKIIEEYAKKDNRIKYHFFQTNKGAVIAVKKCYEISCGKYIGIINSDDTWELNKLEKQISILDKNNQIGAVFGMPKFIDQYGKQIKVKQNEFSHSLIPKTREEWINTFFKKGNCICHPTVLIRRECYENVGFYNPVFRSLPDFEMWVRLVDKYNIQVIDEYYVNFRRHSFNESNPRGLCNLIRCQLEYKQILKTFVNQIKTIEELLTIFPEEKNFIKIFDDKLVSVHLAFIALKRREDFSIDFAFDILYEEMSKLEVIELLERYNLYNPVQLSKDVALADIYKIKIKHSYLYKLILKVVNFPKKLCCSFIKIFNLFTTVIK